MACYVCNLWHPTPVLEKWFGGGIHRVGGDEAGAAELSGASATEAAVVGLLSRGQSRVGEREINLAASSGIDVFMVDWYWHSGTLFLHEWLENAFLKSANRQKIKFALMWANHDWTNFYQSPESGQEAMLLPQVYSDSDFDRLADYLIEHYFHEPNYWTIGGSPVFGIFNVDGLLNQFGGAGETRSTFDRMRRAVCEVRPEGVAHACVAQLHAGADAT